MYPYIENDYVTWLEVRADLSTTTYFISYDYEYIPFLVDTTNKIIYRTGVQRFKPASDNVLLSGAKASKIIQDITYTANNYGTSGNSITVAYINDGVVGQETVTVSGTAISVHIASGVSSAFQILKAVTLSSAAFELVSFVISGNGLKAQTAVGATALMSGTNAVTTLSDFETNIKGSATQVASIDDGIAAAI